MLGQDQESYDVSDLEDFMHDQGPESNGWQGKLRDALKKYSAEGESYSWSHRGEYPPGTEYDFSKIDDMSEKEMIELAKDLKIPPYHLSSVDETQDDDIPTGEYELCDKCFGKGCPECEEGLIDVTGEFKLPNFDDFK
jgi:hypothetical protein